MSTLTEVSEFTATVNQIVDGEDVNAATANAAPQALANRTKYLKDTKAPIDSPEFTGTPLAPTPALGTNTRQLATAEMVTATQGTQTPLVHAETGSVGTSKKYAREDHQHPSNLTSSASDIKMNGTQSAGTSPKPARADHVHPTDTSRAPINAPEFTGVAKADTAPAGTSTRQLATTEFAVMNAMPAGTVIYTASPTVPAGFIKANGAQLSRTIYANLFAAIGTTYGSGDGSTTFNLPDLRGVFPRGLDDGRGIDSGRGIGSFQDDAIRNITGRMGTDDRFLYGDGVTRFSGAFYDMGISIGAGVTGAEMGYTLGFDASRVVPTANENRPVNIALLAVIKY